MDKNNERSWNKMLEGLRKIYNTNPQDKIVAFVDILGFKNKVNDGDSGIRDAMAHMWKTCKYAEDLDIFSFSDCLYIVADDTKLKDVLDLIAVIQRELLNIVDEDLTGSDLKYYIYMLRGGLTKGKVLSCPEENILFGEAVNRAYELESECAEYPGILLEKDIYINETCKKYIYQYKCESTCELDDQCGKVKYFFDYMKYLKEEKKGGELDVVKIKELAEKEMENTKDEKIIKKIEWFIEYLNKSLK